MDLMEALRASVEAAKKNRATSKRPIEKKVARRKAS
jgi:non-homologous end joining protein Ku